MSGQPVPELDDEREIDLRSAWRRLSDRWWLPVGGLVAGAVLGVLVSVSGGNVYQAKTLLYLGQPFAPNAGGQIQSLATNPDTVNEIVRSETVIKKAAAAAGLRPGQLRGNIATDAIVAPGQGARTLSPLVEITVKAKAGAKAEKAADSLASSSIASISTYVDNKIDLLNEQIKIADEGLATADRRIRTALQQQAAASDASGLTLAERFLIQANTNSTLQFYEARQANLRQNKAGAQQLLSLAEEVERSFIVQPASAVRTVATSRRNSAVIGAVLGLLLGGLAAYLADPFLQRRNATAQA
jgi:capsular polysaccharide biosynthesis protein